MDNRQIVLVAIDHATDMERTMASALGIAGARGADVHAIRVEPGRASHDRVYRHESGPRDGWHVAEDVRPGAIPAAAAGDGVRVHDVTLRGEPEHVIPAYAQLYAAGVLVVERDYGSSRFWRNGRVVDRIARQSPIPLLVLPRRRATGRDESAPRRILVPVDFSVTSAVALRTAVGVARRHDARLTLLHTLDDVTPHMTFSGGAAWEVIRSLGAHEKAAAEWLRAKASRFGAGDVDTAVETGRSDDAILETARRVDPDLIVIGSARRSLFDRMLSASTLPGVLRRATVPVLVVPAVAGARPWRRLAPLPLTPLVPT